MGIIAKNIIVGGKEMKDSSDKEEPKIVHEEIKDNYHHEKHGDLQKMINKKSNYLSDMIGFKI